MLTVKDVLAVFDSTPLLKRIRATPERIDALERRIATLEDRIAGCAKAMSAPQRVDL